jgi:hypothetical protein
MNAYKSFKVVWIDDYFGSSEFDEKIQNDKLDWNILFKTIDNKIYRLYDIKFVFLTGYEQFKNFIKKRKNFFKNTFYFFIIDRYLWDTNIEEASEQLSIDIIKKLKKLNENFKGLDYVILSSSSPESFSLKDVDFYRKPDDKDFVLPEELVNRILSVAKSKINLLDFTKIEYKINNKEIKNNEINIFPYIDFYKDFVDLQELNSNIEDKYFIITPKGTSDKFLIQNLFVIFFEYIKYYDYKINYFNLEKIENIAHYLDDHQIIVLRDKWDTNKFNNYENLLNKFPFNSKFVYIFEEEDKDLHYYIEQDNRAKILKINNLKNNNELAEKIMLLFFDYLLNDKIIFNSSKNDDNNKSCDIEKILQNIFYKYKKLLIHPILYRAIVNQKIWRENLDDSIEIFELLNKYINDNKENIQNLLMLTENEEQKKNNEKNIILEWSEKIYENVKKIYDEDFPALVIDTVKFWLKNSWNVDYNIKIDKDEEEKWQKHSFDVLCELLEEYDKLNLINEKKDEILERVKEAVNTFKEITKKNQKDDIKLVSKIIWPHSEFPMPVYMVKKIKELKNKQFYLQHQCMFYVNSTEELKNNYKSFENKIEYYNYFYNLVQSTRKFFPEKVDNFLDKISEKIKTNEVICENVENMGDDLKNDLKRLGEAFLRIAGYFFERKFPDDYGKLGTLVEKVRGKLSNDKCYFKIEDNLNINDDEKINKIKELIEKRDKLKEEELLKQLDNISDPMIKLLIKLNINGENLLEFLLNNKISKTIEFNKNLKKLEPTYLLDFSHFIFNYSLKANLTNYLFNYSLDFNLRKHYCGYPLLSLLADFRNSSEHDKQQDWIWDEEKFKESFIYGYEYIWQMYSYIISEYLSDVDNDLIEKIEEINKESKITICSNEEISNKEKMNFNEFKEKLINEKLVK